MKTFLHIHVDYPTMFDGPICKRYARAYLGKDDVSAVTTYLAKVGIGFSVETDSLAAYIKINNVPKRKRTRQH